MSPVPPMITTFMVTAPFTVSHSTGADRRAHSSSRYRNRTAFGERAPVPLGPRERVVGDLLPAALRGEQVRASLEHRHLGERLRRVVRRVRVLHDRRHQVILTAGDE